MGKKKSKAQKLQLLEVNKARSQSGTDPEVGSTAESDSRIARSLPAVRKKLEATGKALLLSSQIWKTAGQLWIVHRLSWRLQLLLSKLQRIQKQKVRRTQASKVKLQSIVDLLQSVQLPNAREEAAKAIELLDEVEKAKSQVLKEKHNFSLLQKGVYTPEAHVLARMLVQAGCSQEYVGEVIQKVCKSAGVEVSAKMSRRTVATAILEGGIAAEIQLAYEIVKTNDLTLSGDGTTHKHINYESQHIHLKVPSYSDEGDGDSDAKHHSQLFGIFSADDHTSETQVDLLIKHLLQIAERLKSSPLAQRGKLALLLEDFFAKLRGMNSDHAKDQKKVFALLKELKDQFMYETLGAEVLVEMEPGDLFRLLAEVQEKEIAEAGGVAQWNALSKEEQ
ncbi:hypothetical protein L208DRAFT_1516295 [Tricholoma matsutake]|nr:hypothetical protein L208DRAFT_1516295 [Tricholoma matsutake 945]